MIVLQLTDLHIGADWGDDEPAATLGATLARVAAAGVEPDAVVVSGDLTEHGAAGEYELARSLLEPFGDRLHVLPGNHDDRAELRAAFGLSGAGAERIDYAAEVGALRLIVLDTTVPGSDGGALAAEQLGWLGAELGASDRPALIAMHHPPIATGMPAFDAIGLPDADRAALAEVVAAGASAVGMIAGHVHRAIAGEVGGCAAVVAPSTFMQSELDLRSGEIELGADPPGFAVHSIEAGEIASHVQFLAPAEPLGRA